MSVAELTFLKKYSELRFNYYKQNVFNHLPRNYRDFQEIDILFAKKESEKNKEKKLLIETNRNHPLTQSLSSN